MIGGLVGRLSVILIKNKLISRKAPVWRFEYKFTYLKWLVVFFLLFFLSGFSFTNTDDSQDTEQQGKGEEGEDHLSFHSTTSNRSRTFRHSFATLHVR